MTCSRQPRPCNSIFSSSGIIFHPILPDRDLETRKDISWPWRLGGRAGLWGDNITHFIHHLLSILACLLAFSLAALKLLALLRDLLKLFTFLIVSSVEGWGITIKITLIMRTIHLGKKWRVWRNGNLARRTLWITLGPWRKRRTWYVGQRDALQPETYHMQEILVIVHATIHWIPWPT